LNTAQERGDTTSIRACGGSIDLFSTYYAYDLWEKAS